MRRVQAPFPRAADFPVDRALGAPAFEHLDLDAAKQKFSERIHKTLIRQTLDAVTKSDIAAVNATSLKNPMIEAVVALFTEGAKKDKIGTKKGDERLKAIYAVIEGVVHSPEFQKDPARHQKELLLGLAFKQLKELSNKADKPLAAASQTAKNPTPGPVAATSGGRPIPRYNVPKAKPKSTNP